ncbi:MAG: hypothetical protein F6K19_47455, partial [Cyanothece sp. SIO1E1]|nr:hypothetical protein [Cyanothece sp. SIO1E1]
SEDYLKERARDPNNRIQTYQFMEGRRYFGKSFDGGVQEMTFMDLATGLAQHLAKQDFYPNSVLGEGELLIVVNYGVTDFEEDMMETLGITSEESVLGQDVSQVDVASSSAADVTALFDVIDTIAGISSLTDGLNSGNSMTRKEKAFMLGIEEIPDRPDHLSANYEYEEMLRESRYFVVLLAYDYQLLTKTGEKKLLWSTRYNIRTAGQSYQAAIQDMNLVASDFFGKNFKKLTRKRLDDDSNVEIGEIEVITTDSSPAKPNEG